MRKPLFSAVFTAFVVSVAAPSANAQQPQRPMGPKIAVIDLTYLFEQDKRFQALKGELEGDVKRAEEELKGVQKRIADSAEMRKEYNAGTPDYKRLDDLIVELQATLQARVKVQRKEFVQREAKAYFNVYREIADEVRYYAERHGIDVVLRFNGTPADQSSPEAVLKELNKPIVYHNRAIDITPIILEQLAQRRRGAPSRIGNNQQGPPRQGVPVRQR